MSCINQCNICNRLIISTSIAVVDDTLVINIPAPNSLYYRNCDYCILLTQPIPDAATIYMPVGITIGDDTTVYSLVGCDCTPVTTCMLSTNRRYRVRVITTADGGVFRVLSPLKCSPQNNLPGLPVTTAPTP